MPRFFATCARGLEPILVKELEQLQALEIEAGRGGVYFAGEHDLLYRANLWLRTAVRVLQPIHEEEVFSPDELYDACRRVNWSDWMSPDHTLAVDCNVRDSNITHSQYASRRVKDAICDQFRDKVGRRPSVDTETPMIGLNLHVFRNRMILSLDSSWNSLHKRGYRPIQTLAPLNEALAAGLLQFSGWNGGTPLVDWMCGSGTFLIEGAWLAMNRAPGLTRKWFAFMGWPSFDRQLWNAIREEARLKAKPLVHPVLGNDIRRDSIELAKMNAKAAGVGNLVSMQIQDLNEARPPEGPPGMIICNPPYGERIGDEREWVPLYHAIGDRFNEHWRGWRLCVFTSNDWLAKQIHCKIVRKTQFFNGSLPCRFCEFDAK
jgi:putative N6-adenine-specific DNA methylase